MLSLMSGRRMFEGGTTIATLRWTAMLLIVLAAAYPANAQGRGGGHNTSQVPRYTPQSPTVSPYLNLLSRNGSVAGNYYGLVRPLQRQQHFNERTTQQTSSQEQELQRLQQQQKQSFEQPTVKPTGTAGWFHDYGQVSPYQRTDHYYSQWDSGAGPQRRSVRGR